MDAKVQQKKKKKHFRGISGPYRLYNIEYRVFIIYKLYGTHPIYKMYKKFIYRTHTFFPERQL